MHLGPTVDSNPYLGLPQLGTATNIPTLRWSRTIFMSRTTITMQHSSATTMNPLYLTCNWSRSPPQSGQDPARMLHFQAQIVLLATGASAVLVVGPGQNVYNPAAHVPPKAQPWATHSSAYSTHNMIDTPVGWVQCRHHSIITVSGRVAYLCYLHSCQPAGHPLDSTQQSL
jgi:hypothetical protein